jgi:hypothetical protein
MALRYAAAGVAVARGRTAPDIPSCEAFSAPRPPLPSWPGLIKEMGETREAASKAGSCTLHGRWARQKKRAASRDMGARMGGPS